MAARLEITVLTHTSDGERRLRTVFESNPLRSSNHPVELALAHKLGASTLQQTWLTNDGIEIDIGELTDLNCRSTGKAAASLAAMLEVVAEIRASDPDAKAFLRRRA